MAPERTLPPLEADERTTLTAFLDSQSTSYLAWAWNADFDCSQGPGLITDYVPGTPTNFGAAYKAHLASLGL